MSDATMNPETEEMGRVTVAAKIENLGDLWAVQEKLKVATDVRSVEVDDALVDTGATGVGLPRRLVKQLGLHQTGTRRTTTSKGVRQAKVYDAVKLTVQGRDCVTDVTEVGASCPVLIGQLALEAMDFVVDPRGRRVIGNPAHGEELMYDLF